MKALKIYYKYHCNGQDYRTKKVPKWITSQFTEWELMPKAKTVIRGSLANSPLPEKSKKWNRPDMDGCVVFDSDIKRLEKKQARKLKIQKAKE